MSFVYLLIWFHIISCETLQYFSLTQIVKHYPQHFMFGCYQMYYYYLSVYLFGYLHAFMCGDEKMMSDPL